MDKLKNLERFFNCTFLDEDEEQMNGGLVKFTELYGDFALIGFVKDGKNLVLVLEANSMEMTTLNYSVDYICKDILESSYIAGVMKQHGFLTEQNREDYRIAKEKFELQKNQEKQLKDKRQRYQQYLNLKKEFEGEDA
ncbi:hypothetical protein BK776_27830 [Bacillus thuringiensis serovar aizawai]|nr:hypothetical protein BK776_27830 [Bacillus thuringiensis serovar aizawai]